MTLRTVFLAAAVVGGAFCYAASDLSVVAGTDGQNRTVAEVAADRPSLILFTSPRVASVGPQLKLLTGLKSALGDSVALVAVIYGEEKATLAKLREGTPYAIIAGTGEPPAAIIGEGGKLPLVIAADARGDVSELYESVPDPMEAAAFFGVDYDAGPVGPPLVNTPLPDLLLATSGGGVSNLRELAGDGVVFIFGAEDAARGRYLVGLQNLADDMDAWEVRPVILGATPAVAAKLAESQKIELEASVGGPLAEHLLKGDLALPVLLKISGGVVTGIKENARVPNRLDLAAEESAPVAEGPPVELKIARIAPLTAGLIGDVTPVACFDRGGRYVIFSGHFEGGDADHLYEITVGGKGLRQISRAEAADVSPACAPDGVHVAFLSGRDGGNELWTCERVHGEFTRLTRSGGTYGPPSYSPNGDYIVTVRRVTAGSSTNSDLWLMTSRGRRERSVSETFYDEVDPAFGADGENVFFASNRHGSFDVFASDRKGGKRRRLTDFGGDDRMPTASPDGKYVVYASRNDAGVFKLWAMNVDGSSKTTLTDGPGNDVNPRFSPGGEVLLFVSDRTGFPEIYKMTFDVPPDYEAPRPPRPLATEKPGRAGAALPADAVATR